MKNVDKRLSFYENRFAGVCVFVFALPKNRSGYAKENYVVLLG